MNFSMTMLAGLVLTTSACTQPAYRASVATFGEAAQVTAASQAERLQGLMDRQAEDIRTDLAQRRVLLRASTGCAALLIPGSNPNACTVVASDGTPLAQPEEFGNISAMNAAFAAYGKQLAALASDADQDATAFNAALIDLAASADGLSGAVFGGSVPTQNADDLKRGATIGGILLSAAAGVSRTAQLRQIIIDTDPLIQAAAAQLDGASESLLITEIAQALERLEAAKSELETSVRQGASTAVIAAKQATVFDRVDAVRRLSIVRGSYGQLAQTHGNLARAARSGLSDADFEASIIELVTLTNTLRETL